MQDKIGAPSFILLGVGILERLLTTRIQVGVAFSQLRLSLASICCSCLLEPLDLIGHIIASICTQLLLLELGLA